MKLTLLYHNIAQTLAPYGSVVSPTAFRKHIQYIKSLGLKILPPDEFFRESSRVLITFDDGFEDLYRYAFPALQDEGVPALMFVVSGYSGRRNDWDITLGKSSWDKIREMHRYGIVVGSHSHLHLDYTRVSEDLVKKDLKISFDRISEEIGESVKYLSYPFGKAGEEQWETARYSSGKT